MHDYLEKKLIEQEGFKSKVYKDTENIWTIGIGTNVETEGITYNEAVYLMRNRIELRKQELARNISFFNNLDDATKYVLMDMCFNMGITRLLGFKKMLAYLAVGNKNGAADEMLDSKWADQVGNRSTQLSQVMRTGKLI